MCIGCRMRRASEWCTRVMHEASLYESNCFVTLTYGRDKLPPGGSLCHSDFQGFMKRLRFHHGDLVRYFMCGEYGPLNLRPHYHACLFNVDFRSDSVQAGKSASGAVFYDSPTLARLWTHGRVSVQPLTAETAGYCTRYIMKKALGKNSETAYQDIDPETGEIFQRKPEYCAMSLKPGIGARWFEKYHRDVFPHDFVVRGGSGGGAKQPPPRYYDKLYRRMDDGLKFEEVSQKRQDRGRKAAPDNTDERLAQREVVHLARVRTLSRGDLDDASQ